MTSARPVGNALRWSRAGVLSLVALLTGAAAHVSAAGLLPSPFVLVLLVILGAAAAAPLLGRRLPTWQIVGMLVAGQSAVHVVLAGTAGHRGELPAVRTQAVPLAPTVLDRQGSYYDVAYAPQIAGSSSGLTVPEPLQHLVGDLTAHPQMALAHVVAAALCGLWLAVGERALWSLLDLAARGVGGLGRQLLTAYAVLARLQATLTSATRPLAPVAAPLRPTSYVLSRSVSRRGPPQLSLI